MIVQLAGRIGVELAERGTLPDPLVRLGVRSRVRRTVGRLEGGTTAELLEHEQQLAARHTTGPITEHGAAANAQHYEVPTRFFELALGPRMKYSSCYWSAATRSLGAAEDLMLELCDERAGIADGQRILELGCGWGSWSLWLAERYPGSSVTAVSGSRSQREHVERRAAELGLGNLEVVTRDVADLEPHGRFDRVVSVEMFEHVRNHRELLRRIASWLEPDGTLFVHVFSHSRVAWDYDHTDPGSWMARHFFTGGVMPSHDFLRQVQDGLTVERRWRVAGTHYERTLRAWLERLDGHAEEARRALAAGPDPTDPDRQLQRWRLFLLACAGLFGWRGGAEFGLSHYRFARSDR